MSRTYSRSLAVLLTVGLLIAWGVAGPSAVAQNKDELTPAKEKPAKKTPAKRGAVPAGSETADEVPFIPMNIYPNCPPKNLGQCLCPGRDPDGNCTPPDSPYRFNPKRILHGLSPRWLEV